MYLLQDPETCLKNIRNTYAPTDTKFVDRVLCVCVCVGEGWGMRQIYQGKEARKFACKYMFKLKAAFTNSRIQHGRIFRNTFLFPVIGIFQSSLRLSSFSF